MEACVTPEMWIAQLEDADVLTASGEAYTGGGNYGEYESKDAGEFDEFDDFGIDWGN